MRPTPPQIYQVKVDDINYQNLVSEMEWDFDSPFMYGKAVTGIDEVNFRYLTLKEDIAEEQELLDTGDLGNLDLSRLRNKNGAGDCAEVNGIDMALVLSATAKNQLEEILHSTGQLFPVLVEGDQFYIYNCTRLLDAVDTEQCELRYVGKGRPAEFTKLVFRHEVLSSESLFKIKWPMPKEPSDTVDYDKIPPPTAIYASQSFVDKVQKSGLTGFRFVAVGAE